MSLNLSDDALDGKNRSPSTSPSEIFPKSKSPPARHHHQQLPKLEIDNDIVITKLCDENKRLKEHQTQLISKYEEGNVAFPFIQKWN